MKTKHTGFFAVGIFVGGATMFVLLALVQISKHSSYSTGPLPSTSEPQPRLIALEPTGLLQQASPMPASSRLRTSPSPTLNRPATRSTVTPLPLRNGQSPEVIGYSVEGRSLDVYAFGQGDQERMIVAGIHGGDEWNTVTLANQLIVYLDQNHHIVPEDVKLYILPNLNPDGEARAHNKYGRLNHNGVDLNRNFPVNWLADWDRGGCWNALPTSGGTGPGSEAETRALMDFLDEHSVQALISYHSAALGIFPGGLPWEERSSRLAESLAEVTSYRFPPMDTGCTYSGTLADYAVSRGAAAVDMELTNHIDTDFDQNLQALDVLLKFVP